MRPARRAAWGGWTRAGSGGAVEGRPGGGGRHVGDGASLQLAYVCTAVKMGRGAAGPALPPVGTGEEGDGPTGRLAGGDTMSSHRHRLAGSLAYVRPPERGGVWRCLAAGPATRPVACGPDRRDVAGTALRTPRPHPCSGNAAEFHN